MDLIAAIVEVAVIGHFLSVHDLLRTNLGDVGESGQYTLTVDVTKTTEYVILGIELVIDIIGRGGLTRKGADVGRHL